MQRPLAPAAIHGELQVVQAVREAGCQRDRGRLLQRVVQNGVGAALIVARQPVGRLAVDGHVQGSPVFAAPDGQIDSRAVERHLGRIARRAGICRCRRGAPPTDVLHGRIVRRVTARIGDLLLPIPGGEGAVQPARMSLAVHEGEARARIRHIRGWAEPGERHRGQPGPLDVRAMQGAQRAVGLQRLVVGPPGRGRPGPIGRQGVPAHLHRPDRLPAVAVCPHRIAQQDRTREIQDCGIDTAILGPAPEAVGLGGYDVEEWRRPGIVQGLQEQRLAQVDRALFRRGRQAGQEDRRLRIGSADLDACFAQQAHVAGRVDQAAAPVWFGVRLVPDLVVLHIRTVSGRRRRGEAPEIGELARRGEGVFGSASRLGSLRPGRRRVEHGHHRQAALPASLDGRIVRRPVELPPLRLDVRPAERLSKPREPGRLHRVQSAVELRRVHPGQVQVHAQRVRRQGGVYGGRHTENDALRGRRRAKQARSDERQSDGGRQQDRKSQDLQELSEVVMLPMPVLHSSNPFHLIWTSGASRCSRHRSADTRCRRRRRRGARPHL